MAPWIFAASLLAVAGLALLAFRRHPFEWKPPGWRAALGAFAAFVLIRIGAEATESSANAWVLAPTWNPNYWSHGTVGRLGEIGWPPVLPTLLVPGLLVAAAAFVRRPRPAILLGLFLAGGHLALAGWWGRLATTHPYTGRTRPPLEALPGSDLFFSRDDRLQNWRGLMAREVERKGDRAYPGGWLRETGILEDFADRTPALSGAVAMTIGVPAWRPYTLLTGIRALEPRTYALWYPGGPLSEGIHRVGYREVPANR